MGHLQVQVAQEEDLVGPLEVREEALVGPLEVPQEALVGPLEVQLAPAEAALRQVQQQEPLGQREGPVDLQSSLVATSNSIKRRHCKTGIHYPMS